MLWVRSTLCGEGEIASKDSEHIHAPRGTIHTRPPVDEVLKRITGYQANIRPSNVGLSGVITKKKSEGKKKKREWGFGKLHYTS